MDIQHLMEHYSRLRGQQRGSQGDTYDALVTIVAALIAIVERLEKEDPGL